MKTIRIFSFLIIYIILSCDGQDGTRTITYDNSFPKPNKNLSAVLGDRLKLKSGSDTLEFIVSSVKKTNLITNAHSGDTLFYGKVSKFRGLYYFNQAVNDTSYSIYAVKISGNLIYGLTSFWEQSAFIDTQIKKGKLPKLVKYISPDSSNIRLHPDKKEFKKLYAQIINNIQPDTILYSTPSNQIEDEAVIAPENTDPEELELISKVYPIPFKEFVNIEIQQMDAINYELIDMNGKTGLSGNLSTSINRIGTEKLKKGLYILRLTNSKIQQRETLKVVKI